MIEQTEQPTAAAESEDAYLDSLLGAGSGACAPDALAPAAPATLVSLTAAASEKVQALLTQEADPALALRVFVAGGGCSGLQYGMTLDEAQEGDTLVAVGAGLRVVVDEQSAQYLAGSEIDYVDSLMGAGFTVHNPNAVSTCGCGHSFKTAADSGAARACGCGS
jgi:iron-sulfur cluster assembly accessory protein